MVKVAYVGAPLEKPIQGVVEINVLKIIYIDLTPLRKIEAPLALTSKRGVISLKLSNVEVRSPNVYCIGERTGNYLRRLYGLKCLIPTKQDSNGLAELLITREKEVRIVSSDSISKGFLKILRRGGISYKVTTAYKIVENEDVDYSLLSQVNKVLVGSSKSFRILLKNASQALNGKEVYAIGSPTYNEMILRDFRPAGYFDKPDIEKILAELNTEK